MSDSVRPQRQQPTRLPRPWDSPGKNTGVGCHFLLQCIKVKSESEVAQSCLTLSDPMDCSLPGSSVHGFSRQEYWSGVPLPAMETFKKLLAKAPVLGHPNYDLPFFLLVHENKGTALGVLTQQRGGYYQPIGYYSQQLDSVARGLPRASGVCYVRSQKRQS